MECTDPVALEGRCPGAWWDCLLQSVPPSPYLQRLLTAMLPRRSSLRVLALLLVPQLISLFLAKKNSLTRLLASRAGGVTQLRVALTPEWSLSKVCCGRFAARLLGLASGLALAVRPLTLEGPTGQCLAFRSCWL
jgi:hypothetical protein